MDSVLAESGSLAAVVVSTSTRQLPRTGRRVTAANEDGSGGDWRVHQKGMFGGAERGAGAAPRVVRVGVACGHDESVTVHSQAAALSWLKVSSKLERAGRWFEIADYCPIFILISDYCLIIL